jgi:hypothetical protein
MAVRVAVGLRQADAPESRLPRVQQLILYRGGIVGFAIFASIAAGWAIATNRLRLIAPLLVANVVPVFRARPWVAIAAILASTSTFIAAAATPKIAHLYLPEILLGLALVSIASARHARSYGGFDGSLIAVLLAANAGGAVVGGLTHAALVDTRVLVLYAAFWVTLAAWRAGPSNVFAVLAILAVAVSTATILESMYPGLALFRADVLTLQGGVARIRAPGLAAVYFCLVFAVSYLLFGPRRYRILAVALALLSAAAVLASLNRNMIIGASLGVVVSAVFSRRRGRVAAVLVVAALVVWISLPYVSASPYMQRILSVGNYGLLKQSTLSDRYYENGYAWRAITHHPVLELVSGLTTGRPLWSRTAWLCRAPSFITSTSVSGFGLVCWVSSHTSCYSCDAGAAGSTSSAREAQTLGWVGALPLQRSRSLLAPR